MSLDTTALVRSVIDPKRRTTAQLLAAAARDSDACSMFADGTSMEDCERAVFVVKGHENVMYVHSLLVRQGLITDGKGVES